MAIELGQYVVYGELFNTRRNSVHGWLGLLGLECPLHVELTGNCESDLSGKHIRFRARQMPSVCFDEHSLANFQVRQIGPPGRMTAAQQVRVDPRGDLLPPAVEAPPGAEWRPCLYLEWFGQNGRIVVLLVDPVIQMVGPADEENADAFFGAVTDEGPEAPATPGDGAPSDPADDPLDGDPADALFAPIPAGLQRELDRRAAAVDREVAGGQDVARDIWEMELMDDLIDHGVGVPLQAMLEATGPLPPPEALDEPQAQAVLKMLLARLAVSGIAVDMCEHVSALDTYRLLRTEIGTDSQCYQELRGTGWVQHFSTADTCPACEAEFERRWRASHPAEDGEE